MQSGTTRSVTASWGGWALDAALALGLVVVLTTVLGAYVGSPAWLLGCLMALATVLRRHYPLIMLGIVTFLGSVLAATQATSYSATVFLSALLVVPWTAYSVARHVPSKASRSVLVIAFPASIWAALIYGQRSIATYYTYTGSTLMVMALIVLVGMGGVVTPYAIGRRMLESAKLREQRKHAATERTEFSLAAQEQRVRISEAASRAQIARELHDIVAHSLSVIIVQAEGGRALATKKPEAAAEVLGTIAESGREALSEMRRIVSVLRGTPTMSAEYAPTPGLAEITDLVAKSGVDATLEIEGNAPAVPQTLGLTAYRVVQEALTNVLRHAGPDVQASVTLRYSPHLVAVEISDNGRGAASSLDSDGVGNGLRGMRERVASMGGQLLARPRPGGGFEVRALLPIVSPPALPLAPPTGPPVPPHLAPAIPTYPIRPSP